MSAREHEAWENRYKHGKAARTWDAIAREHEGTDKRPLTAECRILAEWMAAYEAADAAAEAAFRALAAQSEGKAKPPMSDRGRAYIFGEVFKMLDYQLPDDATRKRIALKFWKMSLDYDFAPGDMNMDAALKRLGLARTGIIPDYPEDGPVTIYVGEVGWRGAAPTGSKAP